MSLPLVMNSFINEPLSDNREGSLRGDIYLLWVDLGPQVLM